MFFAKKSLGQNFLRSERALRAIVMAAMISESDGDVVVEVGPGQGALTGELLRDGAKVTAIEKDHRLIKTLTEKFAKEIDCGQLKIIEEDILKFDLNELPEKYKLVANIPYYITGAIIRKFMTAANQPTRAVLLVQKEVAERIVARDGKESLLSMSVKVFAKPRLVETVPAGAFVPMPKVDSAILLLENISRRNFKNLTDARAAEEKFFVLLHAGFAFKRKQLLSNLAKSKIGTGAPDSLNLRQVFAKAGLDPKIRAEDLSAEDWLSLLSLLEKR